jgi:hypothetical protein
VKRGGTDEISGTCGDKALHGRGGGSQCGCLLVDMLEYLSGILPECKLL